MAELCCEIIQENFNVFELKKLTPYFKNSVEIYMKDLALQRITAIAFLKEFVIKFWDHCKKEENILSKLLIDIFNELTQFLCSCKDELCLMNYSMLKMKMICQLYMIVLKIDNEIDKIYDALFCDLSQTC